MKNKILSSCLLAASLAPATAWAVSSSELYQNETYTYGRFEARVRYAAGDGVVSSFFLWKPGSEVAGTFWNELDFEKLEEDCRMQTNPLYGDPVIDNGELESMTGDLCGAYHTYAFEWTPTYISWLIDGVEVRREEGAIAEAFEQNAAGGMQIHFNVWPGDVTFGGEFDPAILPVHQYISWVQYSSFEGDAFELQWREDFSSGALPAGWALGNWPSPKGYSTHAGANVTFTGSLAVLSLTADDALGFGGEPPPDDADPVAAGGGSVSGEGSGSEEAPSPPGAAAPGASTRTSSSSGGCSLGARSSAPGHWVWLLLPAGLLASRRRRLG